MLECSGDCKFSIWFLTFLFAEDLLQRPANKWRMQIGQKTAPVLRTHLVLAAGCQSCSECYLPPALATCLQLLYVCLVLRCWNWNGPKGEKTTDFSQHRDASQLSRVQLGTLSVTRNEILVSENSVVRNYVKVIATKFKLEHNNQRISVWNLMNCWKTKTLASIAYCTLGKSSSRLTNMIWQLAFKLCSIKSSI